MNENQIIINLEAALYQRNLDAAEELAKEALAQFPEKEFGYEYMLRVLDEKEDKPYTSMEACYTKLIQINSVNANYQVGLAQLKEEQAKYDDALGIYIHIIEHDPKNVEALLAIGKILLFSEGDPQKAIPFFENAVSEAPLNDTAQYLLAYCYKELNYLNQASSALHQIKESNWGEKELVLGVELYTLLKDNVQLVNMLDRLTTLFPENITYQYDYANQLFEFKQYDKALDRFESCLAREESDRLLKLAGRSAVAAKQYDKALTYLEKGIQLEDDITSRLDLLEAYFELEQYQKVIDFTTETEQKHPNISTDSQAILAENKGMAFYRLGKWQEGYDVFHALQDLDPVVTQKHALYGFSFIEEYLEENIRKAFTLNKQAALAGHEKAIERKEKYFGDYSKGYKELAIQNHEGKIDQNKEYKELAPLLNHYWLFAEFRNEMTKNADEATREALNNMLKGQLLFLTEKGGFIMNPDGVLETFVYECEEVLDGGLLVLAIFPLDGSLPYQVVITEKENRLIYMSQKDVSVVYDSTTFLTEEIKAKVDKEGIDFLGEDVLAKF